MSQSAVGDEEWEAWRDLQEVLEERDREWWADEQGTDEEQ